MASYAALKNVIVRDSKATETKKLKNTCYSLPSLLLATCLFEGSKRDKDVNLQIQRLVSPHHSRMKLLGAPASNVFENKISKPRVSRQKYRVMIC